MKSTTTASRPALPIFGTSLGFDLGLLLRTRGYPPAGIREILSHAEARRTAAGCASIDPDDIPDVEAMIVSHTAHHEFESAADWPAWTDQDIYELGPDEPPAPADPPFEPSDADKAAAAELLNDDEDFEDREANDAFTAWVASLDADVETNSNRISDFDIARSGSVG